MSHLLLIELRAVGALPTAVEFFPVLSSLKASAGRPHLSLARSLSASVATVTLTPITAWADGEECVTVRVDTSSQSNGLTLRFRHAFHRSLPPMMMTPAAPDDEVAAAAGPADAQKSTFSDDRQQPGTPAA